MVDVGFDGDMVGFVEQGPRPRHAVASASCSRPCARSLRELLGLQGHLKGAARIFGRDLRPVTDVTSTRRARHVSFGPR